LVCFTSDRLTIFMASSPKHALVDTLPQTCKVIALSKCSRA
jgi:hypothetical protein